MVEAIAVRVTGCETVTFIVAVHKFASLAVIVYDVAESPEIVFPETTPPVLV